MEGSCGVIMCVVILELDTMAMQHNRNLGGVRNLPDACLLPWGVSSLFVVVGSGLDLL
jgi:hypothetical protein